VGKSWAAVIEYVQGELTSLRIRLRIVVSDRHDALLNAAVERGAEVHLDLALITATRSRTELEPVDLCESRRVKGRLLSDNMAFFGGELVREGLVGAAVALTALRAAQAIAEVIVTEKAITASDADACLFRKQSSNGQMYMSNYSTHTSNHSFYM
jgi:hypothetical protein